MINGAHVVVYSKDAEADKAFLRDVLDLRSVDAGHGVGPGYCGPAGLTGTPRLRS
jgi:catechol 2,3-dioxygenase-like lactoylglutathione lyase family enzyme